ncbi:hypothetical protein RRG08_001624 [Elysia crispata]|uniref:Uncharacterized protein n=1 Tax=Elysia crispata TaxID=231223 RepID=A0AAE1AJZ6_9GAST|nr:hypothetical protein RRG08_001624 [Elysia crispata]
MSPELAQNPSRQTDEMSLHSARWEFALPFTLLSVFTAAVFLRIPGVQRINPQASEESAEFRRNDKWAIRLLNVLYEELGTRAAASINLPLAGKQLPG